jgi:hypothetical protein
MTNEAFPIATPAPRYNIGQVVYLRESAALGFLEAYAVKRPYYELDGTVKYELITSIRPPNALQTIGDRVTGLHELPLRIRESDLISYCDAIDLATDNLALQLSNLAMLRESSGCPEVTETE